MKKWLIGVLATFAVLLIAVLGIDEWQRYQSLRDYTPEEWQILRAKYMGRAVEKAAKNLPKYAAEEGLKLRHFRGPYIKKDANPERPTQHIFYKSDTHYFVYSQIDDSFSIYSYQNIENCEDNSHCHWLAKMP